MFIPAHLALIRSHIETCFSLFFEEVLRLRVTQVTVAGKIKIKHLYYVLPSQEPIGRDKVKL